MSNNNCFVEVNLRTLGENFFSIKRLAGRKTVICVVKSNAYGHGAVEVCKKLNSLGQKVFAVATAKEGAVLRTAGVTGRIISIGYTSAKDFYLLTAYNIEQAVFSTEYANLLNSYCEREGARVCVHIKIDTGMGRFGFFGDENGLLDALTAIKSSGLKTVGIYSHLSCADDAKEKEFTFLQYERFYKAVTALEKRGVAFEMKHLSNSAGLSLYGTDAENAVRIGLKLYGYPDFDGVKPCMRFLTEIAQIRSVPKGTTIGYGKTFTTEKTSKIAVLPIGYADGLGLLNGAYSVKVGSARCNIVGRVCMNQCMIDVTGVDTKIGDEVEVFGCVSGFCAQELGYATGEGIYRTVCKIGNLNRKKYIY